jgi:hypothetical protein
MRMGRITRRFAWVCLACSIAPSMGCRLRTKVDQATTEACFREGAYKADQSRDGGVAALDYNAECKACCHRRGLDDTDPGACACGKLGLDALLR